MITMKTINASDLAQRDAFFESLDKRTGVGDKRKNGTVYDFAMWRYGTCDACQQSLLLSCCGYRTKA